MSGLKYLRYLDSLGTFGTCLPNQAFPYENTGVIIAHLSGFLQGLKSVNCECGI